MKSGFKNRFRLALSMYSLPHLCQPWLPGRGMLGPEKANRGFPGYLTNPGLEPVLLVNPLLSLRNDNQNYLKVYIYDNACSNPPKLLFYKLFI